LDFQQLYNFYQILNMIHLFKYQEEHLHNLIIYKIYYLNHHHSNYILFHLLMFYIIIHLNLNNLMI